MPRLIHPDDGMVYACPECDQSPVYERTGKNVSVDRDKKYRCNKCGHTFDRDPVEREARQGGAGPKFVPDDLNHD